MEKNKESKVIAIIALFIAVIGVSVGFAAFSNTLTINSEATVKPDKDKFDVNFSSTTGTETDGVVKATTSVETITGDDATIDNSNMPKITGLKANFTEPGQTVTYSFYTHNAGKYVAYLNQVIFANVDGESATKVCTAKEGTTQALVDSACGDISISVKVGSETYTGGQDTISSHSLAIDGYEPVVVTIAYSTNADGNTLADGDFDVAFGPISLVYDSVD